MIGILFLTGLLSHYQYEPWQWLPIPARPIWGYRLTQGIHVATGIATIPLLLIKLWSVYPNLFRFPPIRSIRHALERISIAILVSTALVQVTTGFLNVLNWYGFGWYFPPVHRFLGYVLVGSLLLHIGVKLPDIVYGLARPSSRGRRPHRDSVERKPRVAQQCRNAARPANSRHFAARRANGRRCGDRPRGDHHRRPDGDPAGSGRSARPTPVESRSAASASQPHGRAGSGRGERNGRRLGARGGRAPARTR